jgi:sirohydrochlorin ferrochelatase
MSCLEFIEPHPDQAVQLLADQGLRRMVVMPYLLGHGKHATLELDEVLDEIRAQLPQVQLALSEGLGCDERLADLVMERLGDLNIPNGAKPVGQGTTGILLVKAGTRTQYDDCLWFEELGQMVEKRLGVGYAVAVAQSHYGDPTMEAAAARLVEARGATSMVCVPYVFFPGMILRRNVLGGLNVLRGKYPDVNMTITPPLGVDDRLLEVAADRIKAVWNEKGAGS